MVCPRDQTPHQSSRCEACRGYKDARGACDRGARRGHASAPTALDTHAKRAHLAAREEGLNHGVLIVLDGPVGGRVAVLRRGHAESDAGGARGSSAAKRTAGGRCARRWRCQLGARAAIASPRMPLAAYFVLRIDGLRVRREQRLHHCHRYAELSGDVEGRALGPLYVAQDGKQRGG